MNRRTQEQLEEDDRGMWVLAVYGGVKKTRIAQLYGTTRSHVDGRLNKHYEHVSNGIRRFNSFDDKRS